MLEYIAICNAAYSTIKKAIENGRELSSVAKSISQFTHAADDLRKQKDKKKNSIFSKFTGKDETDLDEFFALEEIKEKEEELKRISANAIKLDSDNRRLLESNQMLSSEVDVLKTDNARLRENKENEFFLNGAFAVLIGVMIALIAPRLMPKRRSEWV